MPVMTMSDLRRSTGPPPNGANRSPNAQPMPAYNSPNPSNVQYIARGNDDGNMSPFPSIKNVLAADFNWKTFIFAVSMVQIAVFISELVYQAVTSDDSSPFVDTNPGAGPDTTTMMMFGAIQRQKITEDHQFWRFFTPIFVHASILHIFMNLAFQTMLCYTYEISWGTWRTIFFYFAGGFGGCCLSAASSDNPSVGASGALCAMIGVQISYICLNWSDANAAQRPQELCTLICYSIFLAAFGFMDNSTGASGSAVDNWAHLGGLGCGILLGFTFPSKVEGAFSCTQWNGREYLTGALYVAFIGTTMALIFTLKG